MAAERKIRYALVGAGDIAQVAVLPAFANASGNSELVAIVSGGEEKRKELGRRYGAEHLGGYQDFERILRDSRADAVYIALPNNLHLEYSERAARQGVHVLCEKPMAPTVDACEAMRRGAGEAGIKLMIAYRLHFEESNLGAIEVARSGRIGEPMFFSATMTQSVGAGDIRMKRSLGGGALLDEGVYCINASRYLFGDEPEEVFCFANVGMDPRSEGVDESTFALLRFPRGRLAKFGVSQVASTVSMFRLVGSKGDLHLENAFSYVKERKRYLTVEGETEEKTYPVRDQFGPELIYFSQCILEDVEPEPSGLEGLADVRVVEALQESARTGQPIRLEAFPRVQKPDPSQLIVRPAIERPAPL